MAGYIFLSLLVLGIFSAEIMGTSIVNPLNDQSTPVKNFTIPAQQNKNSNFVVNLSLGSQKKQLKFLIDTRFNFIIFRTTECDFCNPYALKYNTASSSTYRQILPYNVNITLNEGNSVVGKPCQELVWISGYTIIENYPCVAVTHERSDWFTSEGYDGILGLGSNIVNGKKVPPYAVEQLYKRGIIEKKQLIFALRQYDSPNKMLIFGETDAFRLTQQYQESFFDLDLDSEDRYQFTVNKATYGKFTLTQENQVYNTTFQTATRDFLLDQSSFFTLIEAMELKGARFSRCSSGVGYCLSSDSSRPYSYLYFKIDDNLIYIHPNSYFLYSDGKYELKIDITQDNWVFGAALLNYRSVTLDFQTWKINIGFLYKQQGITAEQTIELQQSQSVSQLSKEQVSPSHSIFQTSLILISIICAIGIAVLVLQIKKNQKWSTMALGGSKTTDQTSLLVIET